MLANTLKAIKANGKDAFYEGKIVKNSAQFIQINGGIINIKTYKHLK